MSTKRAHLASLLLCAACLLTGCEVVTGTPQYAQVRFVEISPDAPSVDLYQNSAPILYTVGAGTASSYIPVAPGTYTWSVADSRTHQPLASAAGSIAAGAQYTVLVGDITANLQMAIVKDQSSPAPAGQVALRFVHEATRAGAADLYLVAPGSKLGSFGPIASNLVFGSSPVYLHIPNGTYSLVAVPSGQPLASSPVPLYSGSQSIFESGSVRTIILYDRPSTEVPGLQVLTVHDVDPEQ